MKLISRRAIVVLILSLLLLLGFLIFIGRFMNQGSTWVIHPTNAHIYEQGRLIASGTIYDRNNNILSYMDKGIRQYNENQEIRKALMHTVGDTYGNVATGIQVTHGGRLGDWDIVNGVFKTNQRNKGKNLNLTVDADLCKTAYKALNGRKGTIGVYNYVTGEILCMVSTPTFDPNNPPDIKANPNKYEGVYINRLLSASYVPGSVFKLVTAAAAIDHIEDYSTRTFHCTGEMIIDGVAVTCPTAHGDVTLAQALAVSCNGAFAEMSLDLGGQLLQRYGEKVGFNSSLEVDGIPTGVGKIHIRYATGADLAWAGIGQYSNTANPLNFMAFMGSIGNDGVRVTPELIKENSLLSFLNPFRHEKKRILPLETAGILKDMMRNNVLSNYGENNYNGLNLCAKSGTAEVGGDEKPHAWFAGFLDRTDYPLAFVVVIENGGGGSSVAGPVAAKVLQEAVK
jgi:peptidoglycan glycosyltransferase